MARVTAAPETDPAITAPDTTPVTVLVTGNDTGLTCTHTGKALAPTTFLYDGKVAVIGAKMDIPAYLAEDLKRRGLVSIVGDAA